ncbi:hypothetical protein CHARACLAT_033341, partial [Characodon lateralis]|nr:hypothetical protein [Characodon lateralis]
MEKPVKQRLLEILQDLGEVELKLFHWYLQNPELLDGFGAIKKCSLQRADRVDTVEVMVEEYTSDHVIDVTNLILKKMKITEGETSHVVLKQPSTSETLSVSHTEVQRTKFKQKRSKKDSMLIGSAHFLRRMKQKGLADRLQR